MENKTFPITPPPELVDQWFELPLSEEERLFAAYRAGADQELEACCEWVEKTIPSWAPHTLNKQLRTARRPKPPTLRDRIAEAIAKGDKHQALSLLNEALPND